MHKVPYASAVGSLMYVMVCTQPGIAQPVSTVSRFMSNLGRPHWESLKWILRYLKGTSNYYLCFGNNNDVPEGYTCENMVGYVDTRDSTTSYLYTFAGAIVS